MSQKRIIDTSKGYRIVFNTLSHSEVLPTFGQAHAGTQRAQSKWTLNDPGLADRETWMIKSPEDFLKLLQTADRTRINDSVVLVGTDAPVAWTNFFGLAREKDSSQWLADLYNRVGKQRRSDPVPCAMVFEAVEGKTVGVFRDRRDPKTGHRKGSYRDVSLKGRAFQAGGKDMEVELKLSYLKHSNLQTPFVRKGDLFLVSGMASIDFWAAPRNVIQVDVHDRNAMRFTTLKELVTPPLPQEPLEPRELTYEMLGKLD